MSKGNKVKAAPAPDYTPIGDANKEAAALSAQISREQLDWAKEQYNRDSAVTDKVLDSMLATQESESAAAAADRARYQTKFQPVEDSLLAEASNYANPERVELESGRAGATVAASFDAQRKAAQANLESYGIDPSQTRASALDANTRIAQAAATAGAQNQSRLNTEATGRALRSEAINIGKGYPGQIASAYGTANNAGTSAVNSTLATTASGANTMGTANQWAQTQNQTLGNWGSNVSSQVASANQAATAQQGQKQSMFGTIAGLAVRGVAAYATGGASELARAAASRAYGGEIPHDPMDPEGRSDRVAINVSGGEYVIPASVVRAKGTEFFDKLAARYGNQDDQSAAMDRQSGVPAGRERVAIQGAA